jgi:hypothetical protein
MKHIVWVLLLFVGISFASAQEVYTSSGKPGYHKKVQKKKTHGYDPDKLIIGGGLNAGFDGGYLNLGVSPIVGYRITDNFSAGIGLGYLYAQQPVYVDPVDPYKVSYVRENIIYPNVWARYFVFRNFFVSTTLEQDFIGWRGPGYDQYGNLTTRHETFTNTCLFLGGAIRMPLGGRVCFYGELRYDVLQGKNSPYTPGAPDLHFGFAAGL